MAASKANKLIVRSPNGTDKVIGYFYDDDLRMHRVERGSRIHDTTLGQRVPNVIIEIEGTVHPPELITVDLADLEWLLDDLNIRKENIDALEEGHLDPAIEIVNKIMKGVAA